MFHHVERGRFLVEPAREGALELVPRVAHVKLDERAGELLDFPRRRRLAGPQPDDDVAHANRLARLELKILRDAVALVEQTENRDALGHGRRPRREAGHRLWNVDRLGLGLRLAFRLLRLRHIRPAARCREQRRCQQRGEASGLHWAGLSSIIVLPALASAFPPEPPPLLLMSEPIRPIMSIDPCVSRIMSPFLSGWSDPPGTSAT